MAQENLTDKYQVELEQFLQRLRAEIDILPSLPTGNNDGLEIDEYICQLNTFYYQSFDHHFMPVYLQQVQQSVNEALKLSRTQTMVKKDIMAIIKRYAGLFPICSWMPASIWKHAKSSQGAAKKCAAFNS